jgi:hypothetical protein
MRFSAAAAPALVTIPNIPLIEAGVEYSLSTGPTTFTPDDLRDMVTAANEDPAIPKPRLKIGHNDPRFDVNRFDGEPAFGKFENLRLDENGMVIYADLSGVPKWLADVMPTAYPSRSVEVWWNVTSQAGGQWRAVITAVAALGVVWPGINQLEDLPAMYGESVPDGVEVVAVEASQGGADVKKLFGRKEGAQAAASLDDIRRAFYQDQASGDQYWWWIRDIMTDPNQLVVEDDESGQLYLMSYSSSAEGEVTFGEPEPVRVEYVADKKAAAASLAAAVTAGKTVAVSYASWAESRPINPTMGGGMDRKDAIRRLGLPEDASDEDISTALDEFNASIRGNAPTANDPGIQVQETGTPDEMLGLPPQQHPGTGDNANDQVTPPVPAPDSNASAESGGDAQAALEAARAAGLVVLDRGAYDALRTDAGLGRKAYEDQQSEKTKRVIDEALAAGKFPPSRREAWEKSMAADPAGTMAMLDSLEPNLVPVNEVGRGDGREESQASVDQEVIYVNFPEIRRLHEKEAAIASGTARRDRIQNEASGHRVGGGM